MSEHGHKMLLTVLVGEREGDMIYMASAWVRSIIIRSIIIIVFIP